MAESDLLHEFNDFGVTVEPNVLEKCVLLLGKYDINPETLVNCWLGYSTTKLGGDAPTPETLQSFDKEVLSKEKFNVTVKTEPLSDSPVIHNITTISQLAEDDELLGCYGTPVRKLATSSTKRASASEGTPQNKRLAGLGAGSQSYPVHSPSVFSPSTPGTTTKFSSRTNAGEVMVKYVAGTDATSIDWNVSTDNWKPRIQEAHWSGVGEASLTTQTKYMFSRLRDKYDILEYQLGDVEDILSKQLKIDDWAPNNNLQSEMFRTIGRICCDGVSGSRLNASSLLLEGNRDISSGTTVALDVSQVKEYSFFPGQILGIEGSNPTGKKIVVNTVTMPTPCTTPKTDIDLPGPLNVLVACGPFTVSEDLDFAPLSDLIRRIESLEPQVVILLGPFLDVRNKKIETGTELERTFQEEFDACLEKLYRFIPKNVEVIIVPSWRDVHHRTVYPTPPFDVKKAQPNFHFFSDPCVVNINGVFIAMTSTDILFHLSKEEIAITPQGSDRMSRLVSHIFSQRSFYPLSPPADEMSVDLKLTDTYSKLPFVPHVLLVPSDLRHFIKNVQGAVVVNTERLVKGVSGGTYARLQITGEKSKVQVKAEVVRI